MYAVICDPADRAALWAVDRLRSRLGDVQLVPFDLLSLSEAFEWRLEGSARPRACLRLPDGRDFDTHTCRAVLNRALQSPRTYAAGVDADYVAEEWAAIGLAFLAAFDGRIFNRPDPLQLGGRNLSTAGWRQLAARAGLPALDYAAGRASAPAPAVSLRTLVIGNRAFAPVAELEQVSMTLAALSGHSILGLEFTAQCELIGASPLPDLSAAGEAGADALAELLERAA
jgi:hypothetical protein